MDTSIDFFYVFERDIAMDIVASEEMTSGASVCCGVGCGGQLFLCDDISG